MDPVHASFVVGFLCELLECDAGELVTKVKELKDGAVTRDVYVSITPPRGLVGDPQ
jgi:hypothetical protein